VSWLTGWEHTPADRGQPELLGGAPKLGVHLTQGWSIEHAVDTYRARDGWVHVTVDPWRRRRAQHYPFGIATSRGFRRSSDGWSANKHNVVQVEIVGFTNGAPPLTANERAYLHGTGLDDDLIAAVSQPASLWSDDVLAWLAAEVFAPLLWLGGIPAATAVPWPAQGRLSREQFIGYAGVLGHSHTPDQDHTDPGGLNVPRILQLMAGVAPPATPLPPRRPSTMLLVIRNGNVTLYGAGRPVSLGGMPAAYQALLERGVPVVSADDNPQLGQLAEALDRAGAPPPASAVPTVGVLTGRVTFE
jgi:hypothetical protein